MKSRLQAPPPSTPPPPPPQSSAAIFSEEPITVLRISDYSVLSKWMIRNFTTMKLKSILSTPFELIGSLNCRIALFSKSDSIYLQLSHPLGTEFDSLICFKISILNTLNVSNSMSTVSFYRFTDKNRSYGWNDIGLSSTVVDPKLGFISNIDDTLTITADIRILKESKSFTPDNNESSSNCGKFTWTVRNFRLLVELIKNRNLMSPSFVAEDCILQISIHRSVINDVDYLSLFLESEEKTEKSSNWCMFRMSVVNQNSENRSIHRDSHGRVGETNRIGWIDFMELSRFIEPNEGFLVHDDDNDTAVFSVSFQVIKESIEDPRKCLLPHKPDLYPNRYVWKIENFTRLKDSLKMWNIEEGLAVQSPMIKIGDQDLRLVIYPQGKSQPSDNLSFYLEVMERPDESSDWSYYISFRLSVMNQKKLDKSVSMDWGEGEKRESNTTKELGWLEFMLLNNLFDQDSGYLVGDSINFFAEVILLEETFLKGKRELENAGYTVHETLLGEDELFLWRMHNFLSFKNILETNQNIFKTIRIIVSQTFQVGECRLQIGVSQYSDFIIAFLECYPPVTNDTVLEVRVEMSLLNQEKILESISRKETASTKKPGFMKFMKASDLLDQDAGFLRDKSVIFCCRILQHGPKTESSEAEFKLKLEIARSAKEKKDLERELEQFRSERNEEITQLSVEKEDYKNRFHNLERQFSQLKSRNSDCFQRLQKKMNDLAERLEIAESSRQRSDDKLKSYAEKNEVQESVMHSLQDEIGQLKVTVERLEREKLDKDKRISQLETDINGMEANFSACQRLEEEKNDLAERLKTEESARKISDDKLKCYAIDILAQKNEIRQLKVTVEQLEQEKLINEGRIKQLETENDGIKKKIVDCQQLELEEMHTELRKGTVIVDHGTFPISSWFGPITPPSRSTGQLAASVSQHGSPAQHRAITPPSSRTTEQLTSDSLHGNPAYYRAITSPSLSSRSTEQSASVNPVHNIEHVTHEGAPPWHDQT